MTCRVGEAREGQFVGGAAALMIKPQRIGPRERASHRGINEEREGSPQSGHGQAIFAGRPEFGKISFQHRLKALSAKVAQEGIILTEDQVRALEKAKQEKEAHGEIETEIQAIWDRKIPWMIRPRNLDWLYCS